MACSLELVRSLAWRLAQPWALAQVRAPGQPQRLASFHKPGNA